MRIAVAVVIGAVVLSSSGHTVWAAEAPRPRSENCLDGCDFLFDKCQAREGAKSTGRCHIDVVRCKNECPYEAPADPNAPPTVRSHNQCVDACRGVYKKCLGRAENKRNGSCAADDMRCEKACPKPAPEPELVEAPPAAPAGEPGAAAAPGPAAPRAVRVVEPVKPKKSLRVEGVAAPAPVTATPAVATREIAAAPPAVAPPAAAPAEPSSEAARPVQSERGFWGTLGCFFRSCEPAGSTPCLQGCANSYDQCRAHESKRGGECQTRLMHCRQSCRDAQVPPVPAR
jgi:hypothetical protein